MHDVIERTDDTTDVAPPAAGRASRPYLWWVGGAATVVLLVLLGVAEATWLHDLPQDRASRVSLIAVPDSVPAVGQAGSAGTLPADWSAGLLGSATNPALLGDVITRLDLRDAQTGQPMTVDALARSFHLGDQCIEVSGASGPPRRGLLINAVVRTTGPMDPDDVMRVWSDRFIAQGRAGWPGLTIQSAMGVQYEICR
ncbi:MAG: hypothetical protein IT340_12470 [Chloroflexi bacterium]|nr:hypothetical protein [Chloroflexota bacterium]